MQLPAYRLRHSLSAICPPAEISIASVIHSALLKIEVRAIDIATKLISLERKWRLTDRTSRNVDGKVRCIIRFWRIMLKIKLERLMVPTDRKKNLVTFDISVQ